MNAPASKSQGLLQSEDWWSVWLGAAIIALAISGAVPSIPSPAGWEGSNLGDAFAGGVAWQLLLLGASLAGLTLVAVAAMGGKAERYVAGFAIVFLLAAVAKTIGEQANVDAWHLGYALWALLLGLLIANTVGTPDWLKAGARSELFIKIGLVLLGCEILASKIIALGGPGLIVAWIVTPVVILFMFWFGTRRLGMASPSLAMVIACATSVCGVSAAVASAAACRATKEELTLAIGMTMVFTVAMMIGMPALSVAIGLDTLVAGAWIGGTVDSTGAVVASGAILGSDAEAVASVVKMIQNTMIGLVAFLIAIYWVARVERTQEEQRPGAIEIWNRFPKFVLGFLAASLFFSFVAGPIWGEESVAATLKITKALRGWWFALAFCAIGLESDFRLLVKDMVGGKPILLYATGQTLNIALTLLAAYLAFGGVLFPPPAIGN